MKNIDILEDKTATFKTAPNSKIMKHVFHEYSEKQIKEMYGLLSGDTFNYGLDLNEGDTIIGKVAGETSTDYLFDIGYKDYLRVEKRRGETDALIRYANDGDSISEDTEIEILITQVSDSPYIIRGSLTSLHKQDAYSEIIKNPNTVIEATVVESTPAGFTLELNYNNFKIPAFMPNILAGVNKLSMEQGQELLNKKILVMVESFSTEKGTFIASRKKYLKTLIPLAISKLVSHDGKNPISYTGVVTGTAKFGIFVEFNEFLTGMIHKDNLSDEYKTTYQSVAPGSEIEFFIKEIINDKLILTQVWKETIWDTVAKDSEYEGVVYDEKTIGTLVRLDEETVGLIHASEFTRLNIPAPSIGQKVKVRVTSIHKMDRRIYLSLAK